MKSVFFNLKSIPLFLILALPTISWAQSNQELDHIKSQVQASKDQRSEKIFVHTDKQVYLPGEILWFKAYHVTAATNKAINNSNMAYVELLNDQKEPVLQAKVVLTDGLGSGSFYLPPTLGSGNYLFRAYSDEMKSLGSASFFSKEITILNVDKQQTTAGTQVKYDLQFFPEGGKIVDGIPTKVAFKLSNQFGQGVDFEGLILDQRDQIVKEIKSHKFGIGSFSLAPAPATTYKVKIYLKNGQIIDQNLPAIFNEGYGLNVSTAVNGQVKVKVSASKSLEGQKAYLVVHAKNKGVKFAEALPLKYQGTEFLIDEQILDAGISEITLFNEKQQPVAERLYFKRPQQDLSFELLKSNTVFGPRKPVNLTLQTTSKSGKIEPTQLSVAVYQIDSLSKSADQEGIFDYLWLSSELKGKIESPTYYFSANNAETRTALDNLMLSHGWRDFGTPLLSNNELSLRIQGEQQIVGQVTNANGEGVGDVLTYLSLPGKALKLYVGTSNPQGLVTFNVKDYYGVGELIFQTNDPRRNDFHLQLLNPYYTGAIEQKLSAFESIAGPNADVLDQSIAVQVQNSFATPDQISFDLPKMDTHPFFYQTDKTYNLEDYTRFRTMEEVLKEYIAQAALRKTGDNYHLFLYDANRGFNFSKEPLVLFNGIPTFNTNKLIAFDPLKVQYISLINKRYYYGPMVADGIINFITYDNDDFSLTLDPKALVISYDGLQAKRVFYTPKYDTEEQIKSRMPDFRTLLQWLPDVKTDAQGKAEIKLYTSDLEGNFRVVINGLSAGGQAASYISEFKVLK